MEKHVYASELRIVFAERGAGSHHAHSFCIECAFCHISWQRHERGQLSRVHGRRRNAVLHDECDHSGLRVGQKAIRLARSE